MDDYIAQDYDVIFKVLLLGDSGTGKSSLILRYTDNTFNGSLVSSIGVDFKLVKKEVDGNVIKIQIWDTAGHERFRSITTSYYRGADCILIVYDISDRSSFEHITEWLKQIERNANSNVLKILVGNKSDLSEERKVSQEEAQKYANEHLMPYLETSAKDGTNTEQIFELATQKFLAENKNTLKGNSVKLERSDKEEGCC